MAENRSTIEAVYQYYGGYYLRDPRFEWTGMANLIGASFYGGFLDIAAVPTRMTRYYETTFLRMQKKIFEDQAMMHEAYLAGGVPEVEALHLAGIIDSACVRAWKAIDGSDPADWHRGNRWLLYREQDDILDHFYAAMRNHHGPEGAVLTYLLTLLGAPSVPGASGYPTVFPLTIAGGPLSLRTPLAEGNISLFPNRWGLIEDNTLPAYLNCIADPAVVQELIRTPIGERVPAFRLRRNAGSILAAALTRWRLGGTSDGERGAHHPGENATSDGRRPVWFDLSRQSPPQEAAVHGWERPRHRPFPICVKLPNGRRYEGRPQLVKVYRPVRTSRPTRLTVKLPAADLAATERTLRELARDLYLDEGAVGEWIAEVGRSAAMDHHYSTRVFVAERIEFVEIEVQVEHHVAEARFVVDILFSAEPSAE